jgi:hypothetical protein
LEEAITAIDNQYCHDANQEEEYKNMAVLTLFLQELKMDSATMSPPMAKILSDALFVQTDITYNANANANYPYLFNAVAYNNVTMDWMVVSRVVSRVWLIYSLTWATNWLF